MSSPYRLLVLAAATLLPSCASIPGSQTSSVSITAEPGSFSQLQATIAMIETEYIQPIETSTLFAAAQGGLEVAAGAEKVRGCKQRTSADEKDNLGSLEKQYDCLVENQSDVEQQRIVDSAIKSMMSVLDAHSKYVTAEDMLAVSKQLTIAGLGLVLQADDGGAIVVVETITNNPAARLGILPGDRLIDVDGNAVTSRPLRTVIEWLRGEVNSEVHITIQRNDEQLTFVARRALVRSDLVDGELVEVNVAYLKIRSFATKRTSEGISRQIEEVLGSIEGKLQGLIIDVRGSSGGALGEVAASADLFVDHGLLLGVSGRSPRSNLLLRAKRGDAIIEVPIVVLVDKLTGSGAEIFAAILQEAKHATIVGTRTYGNDNVQTVFPYSGGGYLKLTTGKLYRPSKLPFGEIGVFPDICVVNASEIKRIDTSTLYTDDARRNACPSESRSYKNRTDDLELRTALEVISGRFRESAK